MNENNEKSQEFVPDVIRGKVRKFSEGRKIIEIPAEYRNDYEPGQKVLIKKEKE